MKHMKACPLADVAATQSMSGYFYLCMQIIDTQTGSHRRLPWEETNTDAARAQAQTKAIKHTHHFTRAHTHNRMHAWDEEYKQPLQLRSILHNDTVTFPNIPRRQEQVNDQQLLGMKRDYALGAANQMKGPKKLY